jgi:hypothetical protein
MLDFTLLEKLGPLKNGCHSGPTEGACVMEAVAYIAGEKWSDHPECVSPVIGVFLRSWNDGMPTDADRDRLLKPLIPKIINTRSTPAVEEQRSYLALDWMTRTFLPTWLRLAKINDHADKVEALAPIVDMETATAAGPIVRAANEAASKAWDAAGAAARDAAGAAAWAAAGDAAWDAAGAAARDAAGAAAGAAAGDAAGAAAGDAAWDAAWAAAGDAAWDAAWAAAGDAAWDAAWAALNTTRDQLQLSSVDLVERMAALGKGGGE